MHAPTAVGQAWLRPAQRAIAGWAASGPYVGCIHTTLTLPKPCLPLCWHQPGHPDQERALWRRGAFPEGRAAGETGGGRALQVRRQGGGWVGGEPGLREGRAMAGRSQPCRLEEDVGQVAVGCSVSSVKECCNSEEGTSSVLWLSSIMSICTVHPLLHQPPPPPGCPFLQG